MFDIDFPWDQELILTPGLCVLVTWVDLTRVTDLGSLLCTVPIPYHTHVLGMEKGSRVTAVQGGVSLTRGKSSDWITYCRSG